MLRSLLTAPAPATRPRPPPPDDCPAVPGDGQCTGGKNAANTPQDCPAILGDGHCTHNETPASALADCPPPDLVFTGGSLAGLRSVSPSLYFGELTITGPLSLTPSDNEVVLHVESFTLSVRVDKRHLEHV